ncbi:MAG: HemK2/MTQ2 family protein methyltransferase [Nanoarchaeota archaeon]
MKSEIYSPAEDSYLLAESVQGFLKKQKDKKIKILDMGSGSGIQAQTCKQLGFNNILAADINPEAVKYLKKQKTKAIHSNLFSRISKKQKFNLIIFNPPYLPADKYDNKPDTTAGKKGYELIIKFLRQAKSHLDKKGVILLLFSSLSKPKIIKKQAKDLGYNLNLLNKQKLFFEELYVYELKINN